VQPNLRLTNQQGFSIIELIIATAVMLIITAAVLSLVRSAISVATATYELTDAEENLRIAQEYINRDLMNAGDGLKSMTYIPVNTAFAQNYLTLTPIADTTMPSGVTNLGILTTDNQVPANTSVPQPSASPTPTPVTVLAGTDRQTILEIDPDPANIPYVPTTISSTGNLITLPSGTDMNNFANGEIYFLTSSKGGTFAAITNVDAANKQLTFNNGDPCGINTTGSSGRIRDIAFSSTGSSIPTALQRMKIIHYFVNSNGLLIRREFGVKGKAYRDSTIAEHVLSVQFVYSIGLDSGGNPVQPTDLLTTPAQQVSISQVEVTVTVETPHGIRMVLPSASPGPTPANPTLSGTTSTSLRNMQFRQALQPSPSPTP
jgi:prepilin-type N-terminal cleavage/methylation domain-containing protein